MLRQDYWGLCNIEGTHLYPLDHYKTWSKKSKDVIHEKSQGYFDSHYFFLWTFWIFVHLIWKKLFKFKLQAFYLKKYDVFNNLK